jgi:hypothetical protein
VFQSLLLESGGARAIHCFTRGSSCTVPEWVRDAKPSAAITGPTTAIWLLNVSNAFASVDELATTNARDVFASDDFTVDASYRAENQASGIAFP